MLHITTTVAERRLAFRNGLTSDRLQRFAGAYSPIVAKLLEDLGYDGVYIAGASLSADLALPDIGLTTLSEVSQRGYQVARATNLPTIIDVDTGFGELQMLFARRKRWRISAFAACISRIRWHRSVAVTSTTR